MHTLASSINSMLWAAYGDSLGYVTELATKSILQQRIHDVRVNGLVPHRRLLGGRFGVGVDLPAGVYSDDTQLRLATSRCIRSDGSFDVEAFAKIEVPVWQSYALGGGIGTRVAAESLAKIDTSWATNFFRTSKSNYFQCGGNGAAMRIQPHVLSASAIGKSGDMLRDVLRNAIISHGNARGFIGAAFHALELQEYLDGKCRNEKWDISDVVNKLHQVPDLMLHDSSLGMLWIPIWEAESRISLFDAVDNVCHELRDYGEKIKSILNKNKSNSSMAELYEEIVSALGADHPEIRGSGTLTVILASVLAFIGRDNPCQAMVVAANQLGSDTDTIASMAGALLGAVNEERPPQRILDQEYIISEASRLWGISQSNGKDAIVYSDLMRWKLPSALLDYIGKIGNDLSLAGLGRIVQDGEPVQVDKAKGIVFSWYKTSFGQSLLMKSRINPNPLSSDLVPSFDNYYEVEKNNLQKNKQVSSDKPVKKSNANLENASLDLNLSLPNIQSAYDQVVSSNFDPTTIGKFILEYCGDEKYGAELAIGFTAIVAMGKMRRAKKSG